MEYNDDQDKTLGSSKEYNKYRFKRNLESTKKVQGRSD
jgi:hypothetical protein